MQNKTPRGQGNRDPSPDRELEQYGVWVKAEPFDVVEEPETDYRMMEGSPKTDRAPRADGLLSEAEERSLSDSVAPSLDDLPDISMDEELPSFDDDVPATMDEALSVSDFSESVIDIPLDDLDYSQQTEREAGPASNPALSGARRPDSGIESMEISLDEFGISDEPEPEAEARKYSPKSPKPVSNELEHVDMSDFGLEEEPAHGSAAEGEPGEDIDLEPVEIDLEFDDTIPSIDEESSGESVFDFNGLDSLEETVEGFDELLSVGANTGSDIPDNIEVEEVSLDAEDVTDSFSVKPDAFAEKGKKLGASPMSTRKEESYVMQVPDSSDSGFLPEISLEEMSIDGSRTKASKSSSFDDVRAFERELGARPAHSVDTTSASLLSQIARELSGIKEELVNLKSQLKALKTPGPEAPAVPGKNDSAEAKGGFFDEEEDDTIALTGDELDNILNTADFTEESVEEGMAAMDSRESPGNILPETGDYLSARRPANSENEPGIEIINLSDDEPLELETGPDFHHESSLPADGVIPFTEAPSDTSYLDAAGSADEESLFSDMPLVEPDLSDITVDLDEDLFGDSSAEELQILPDDISGLSIEEPLPEFEEIVDIGLPGETPDDLVLDIDSFPSLDEPDLSLDSMSAGIPEDETIFDEDLPELDEMLADENDSSGILLHQERSEPNAAMDDDEEILEFADADFGGPESEKLNADLERSTIKPSQPIQTHPDDISLSLDDSFFVGDEVTENPEEERQIEDLIVDAEPYIPRKAPTPPSPAPKPRPVEAVMPPAQKTPAAPAQAAAKPVAAKKPAADKPPQEKLKSDVKSVLLYLDQLLESLPDEKIEEFASSEYYVTYKKLFDELGLL